MSKLVLISLLVFVCVNGLRVGYHLNEYPTALGES